VLATRRDGFRLPPARRFLLWGFRTLVILVLLCLLLLGVRDIVRNEMVRQSTPPATGGQNTPANGFPQQAAQVYASRFAIAYATFDSKDPMGHQNALQQYLPDGVDPMLGWDGQGKQIATQALPYGIDVTSSTKATVSVAVEVDGGRWLYLAVPVITDQRGFVIPASPSLLEPPSKAPAPSPSTDQGDPGLAQSLTAPMTNFFKAYAASNATDLARYVTPGTSLQGLRGTVQLATLVDLHVSQGGVNSRQAVARVKWSDPSSNASLTQSYRLTLQQINGQWDVSSVQPAGG
jgi:Conjugative transposon protein TcpC